LYARVGLLDASIRHQLAAISLFSGVAPDFGRIVSTGKESARPAAAGFLTG